MHEYVHGWRVILEGGPFAVGMLYLLAGLFTSLMTTGVCAVFNWGRPPNTDDEAVFAFGTCILFWPLIAIPIVPLFAFIVARGLLWGIPRRFFRGMRSLLFGLPTP